MSVAGLSSNRTVTSPLQRGENLFVACKLRDLRPPWQPRWRSPRCLLLQLNVAVSGRATKGKQPGAPQILVRPRPKSAEALSQCDGALHLTPCFRPWQTPRHTRRSATELKPRERPFGSNACDRYKALLTRGKKITDPLCRWHTTLSI